MVSAQPWYNGGYRANIVTYTLAVISEIVRRQGKAIDYGRVWNAQGINGTFEQALADISKVVNEEIIRPPTGISNISEWYKKDASWTGLQNKLDKFEKLLSKEFVDEMLSQRIVPLSVRTKRTKTRSTQATNPTTKAR